MKYIIYRTNKTQTEIKTSKPLTIQELRQLIDAKDLNFVRHNGRDFCITSNPDNLPMNPLLSEFYGNVIEGKRKLIGDKLEFTGLE